MKKLVSVFHSVLPVVLLPVVLLVAVLGPKAVADTYPRQPGVDAVHYSFRLTLNDDNDEIIGEATIDLRFVQAGVSEVAFDLASAAGGKGKTVTEVASSGVALSFKHQADRLNITLAAPSKAGARQQFTIRYRGVPANG